MNLTSDNLATFETAVADLATAAEADPGEAERLCAKAFEELREGALADDEISRRARRIGESLRESQRPLLTAVTAAARGAGPNIRSGILAVLTPALRAELYRSPGRPDSDKDPPSANAAVDVATEEQDEAREDLEAQGEWQTVLLLGDADEIQSNERFLDQYDIRAIRVADESALAALAGESFSAVVVHPGFWGSIPADRKIVDVLRAQFQRASIAHFRIDSTGLGGEAAEVDELLQELGSELRSRIVLAVGSQLSDIDVIAIRRFSALLESAKSSRISVEGLTERESRLLCASVALFSAGLRSRPSPSSARDLRVAALTEGRSTARVLRVLADETGMAFVAKLDDVSKLTEELRVARVVMPDSQLLQMEIYALGGSAVLLQRLVADHDEPMRGARSFRERIEARSAWERGRDISKPLTADLRIGVDRLTQTLKLLSVRSPEGMDTHCWTRCEPLEALREQGLSWRIDSSLGIFDPLTLIGPVQAILRPFLELGLVHGDLHAGNVLLADDRTPLLIDFATAGAGHPMFDFVRFGSAVAFASLASVAPENEMREMFAKALVEGLDADSLSADFPDLLASDGTKLGVYALCATRQGSLGVAAAHGIANAEDQFLALSYLVAAQSLTRREFESGVVRAALGALHPPLAGLSQGG